MVQGVLNSLLGSLGARAGSSESIAAFIQRLSGSSNIFEPGADGALGEQVGAGGVPRPSPGRGRSVASVEGCCRGRMRPMGWWSAGRSGGEGHC